MNPKSFRRGGTIGKALNYTVKNLYFTLKIDLTGGGTLVPSLGPVECGRFSLLKKPLLFLS